MIRPYLKTKVERRDLRIIGTHIEMKDAICSEILGRVGYDFILIDATDSESGYTCLRNHIAALNSSGTPTIVRAESAIQSHIGRILDLAPDGIVFTGINNAEQANDAVSLCFYPPEGRRRYSPLRAVGYGLEDAMTYVRRDSLQMCRFIQLDSADSLRNLPRLIQNPHIDGFIFSPSDIIPGITYENNRYGPDTVSLLKEATSLLRENKKRFGVSVMTTGTEVVRFWIRLGATMIASGTDFGYIMGGAAANLKIIKAL